MNFYFFPCILHVLPVSYSLIQSNKNNEVPQCVIFNFFHCLVTSFLSLNVPSPCSHSTLNFHSSFEVRDQILYQHKTTGKIIILYILVLRFFGMT
jgi:hypothetical protein